MSSSLACSPAVKPQESTACALAEVFAHIQQYCQQQRCGRGDSQLDCFLLGLLEPPAPQAPPLSETLHWQSGVISYNHARHHCALALYAVGARQHACWEHAQQARLHGRTVDGSRACSSILDRLEADSYQSVAAVQGLGCCGRSR